MTRRSTWKKFHPSFWETYSSLLSSRRTRSFNPKILTRLCKISSRFRRSTLKLTPTRLCRTIKCKNSMMSTFCRAGTVWSQKPSQKQWQRTCRCPCKCNSKPVPRRMESSREPKETGQLKLTRCATTHLKCIRHQRTEILNANRNSVNSSERILKKIMKK